MWIVMTSSAKMPANCWGIYRRVALVKLSQEYTARDFEPAMISARARGVLRVIDLGNHFVGKTERCAYERALALADARAVELNNTAPIAEGELLSGWASA